MLQSNYKEIYLVKWNEKGGYDLIEVGKNLLDEKHLGFYLLPYEAEDSFFEMYPVFDKKDYSFERSDFWDAFKLTEKNKTSFGYHVSHIDKGNLGEPSKIMEEVLEFHDAVKQGVSVMAILELADLIGAVELYLEKHHPTITVNDLIRMKDATRRAFSNGHRN